MTRVFNSDGYCDPELHYMVDLSDRLKQIQIMVDKGNYFTINKARQFGKTTVLTALADYLKPDYDVISLDFQGISSGDFSSEQRFVAAVSRQILIAAESLPEKIKRELRMYASSSADSGYTLSVLFMTLLALCKESEKKIVLLIDEVDSATNNQVFLDFLAQLRFYYLKRRKYPVFQSVILAGVHDVRNVKRKIRPDEDEKGNSPWNIATDFLVDLSFSASDIEGMLSEYEADHHTGMNIYDISSQLYAYTSGYPYLVSRLCKLMDEKLAADFQSKADVWSLAGIQEAVKILLTEKNSLFDSLIGKLHDYPGMRDRISALLFAGRPIVYNPDDSVTDLLQMFGFVREEAGFVQISNRIFEMRLYNYFLTLPDVQDQDISKAATGNRNQFIQNGQLNMRHILERFVEVFDDIYGDREQKFVEEVGRKYFLLFLKPIINGTGNYYVESRTRNQERTDLIVDYRGSQYIIELKVWHGNAYNNRGEKQLTDYLEHYHLKKGYMLSFNFNKSKVIGVQDIILGDKVLVEAVV